MPSCVRFYQPSPDAKPAFIRQQQSATNAEHRATGRAGKAHERPIPARAPGNSHRTIVDIDDPGPVDADAPRLVNRLAR